MNKTRSIIFAVLSIVWCAVIFALSAQNGDRSSQTSGEVIEASSAIFGTDFPQSGLSMDTIQFIVRKSAHFCAYLLLAVLSFQFFEGLKKPSGILKRSGAVLIFCALYAASDEIHQRFVPNRCGQLRDVLIDCSGALVGIILSIAVMKIFRHFKMKKANKT